MRLDSPLNNCGMYFLKGFSPIGGYNNEGEFKTQTHEDLFNEARNLLDQHKIRWKDFSVPVAVQCLLNNDQLKNNGGFWEKHLSKLGFVHVCSVRNPTHDNRKLHVFMCHPDVKDKDNETTTKV